MTDCNIYVNTRNTFSKLSGVQRYTRELVCRMKDCLEPIFPSRATSGITGHMWEQISLPFLLDKTALLWSPANTGPLSHTKQVVTIHDMSVFEAPEGFNKIFSTWYKFLLPRLAQKSQKIIAVSHFTKKKIEEYCKIETEKIVVIHNGIDERFKPENPKKVENIRKKLGIPSPHYFLALGSLEPRKNLSRLLKAWENIQPKLPDEIWLVVAGVYGKSNIFSNFALENLPPRVYTTGYITDDDLPALYSGAIASPYLSVYEGFGLPPLEAMACGTPPITGSLTSLPEVIGDAGIMVNPYDIEDIGYGLQRVIDDTVYREGLCEKGVKRAKLFSWGKTAELTRQVLIEATKLQDF